MNADQYISVSIRVNPRLRRKTSYGLVRTLAIAGRL